MGWIATVLHAGFAVAMVATVAFSSRSWEPEAAYRGFEDVIHSVAATAMGFAFAFGVLAVLLRRDRSVGRRWLDGVAIAAAIVLPLGMLGVPDLAGLLQRVMFVVAYVWYAAEATDASTTPR